MRISSSFSAHAFGACKIVEFTFGHARAPKMCSFELVCSLSFCSCTCFACVSLRSGVVAFFSVSDVKSQVFSSRVRHSPNSELALDWGLTPTAAFRASDCTKINSAFVHSWTTLFLGIFAEFQVWKFSNFLLAPSEVANSKFMFDQERAPIVRVLASFFRLFR